MIDVTCAIIIKHGKVLLAQNKAASDHPYQWEFPGGKIESGENPEACIVREIQEELNLKIEILRALQPVEHIYKIKTIRLIPFVCRIVSGEIKLHDHQDTKWVKPAKLAEYDLAEADRQLIFLNYNRLRLKEYVGK